MKPSYLLDKKRKFSDHTNEINYIQLSPYFSINTQIPGIEQLSVLYRQQKGVKLNMSTEMYKNSENRLFLNDPVDLKYPSFLFDLCS